MVSIRVAGVDLTPGDHGVGTHHRCDPRGELGHHHQLSAAFDGGRPHAALAIPANFQGVVTATEENCESVVMLPGMNSFYLWTHQEPPGAYKPTDWSLPFDDARQQRVIETTRSIDRFCLIENVALTRSWDTYALTQSGPLDRYLRHGFVPIAKFDDYELLKRAETG